MGGDTTALRRSGTRTGVRWTPKKGRAIGAGSSPWVGQAMDGVDLRRCLRWSSKGNGELKAGVRLPRTDAFISQCCRIATIPRRIPLLNFAVNGTRSPQGPSAPAAIDLNIEVPDLLAQGVAVEAEQVG